MEIPATVLEILKCSSCGAVLSRGPVYLQHDEAAVCGRCYTPEHSATRNKHYEATAKLLKFPCKYRELGCPETVPFVDEAEVVAHEEVCEHRQYVCPVLGSAHCDWLGTRAAMLEHCRDQHLDNVLENPCSLTHDISKSSMHNYILRAFQLLFLLHTKVCVATGKIFHSVRFLGTAEEATNFFYSLNIKRGNEQLWKEGQVVPQDIQEDSSVVISSNSLLDVLGGLDGTTFTITVKQKINQPAKRIKLTKETVSCVRCKSEVTIFRYRDRKGWRCERCTPDRRSCDNQGCTYTDIIKKFNKHESFFCQQRNKCDICQTEVPRGTLSAHYSSEHQDITCRSGSTWRATRGSDWRQRLLSCDAGTAVCRYLLSETGLRVSVYIPVSSERLREFRCELQVIHPGSGDKKSYTPEAVYNWQNDWFVWVKKEDLGGWSDEFDIVLDVTKVDSNCCE